MSKPIAVFLNTNKLGGAERSLLGLLDHCHLSLSKQFKIYYPQLDGKTEIQGHEESHPEAFQFAKDIYHLSRSGRFRFSNLMKLLMAFIDLFKVFRRLNLKNFSDIWINGNKVAYPILFFLSMTNLFCSEKYQGRILWFWRDYPLNHFVLRYLFLLFDSMLNLTLVANSQDVKKSLQKILGAQTVLTIYPLPDDYFQTRSTNKIQNIGVPAMLTPWKGQLQVLEMVKHYQEELKRLGILKICLFGEQIYQTEGVHQNYKENLLKYCAENALDLISFEGKKSPKEIMESSDLIIHSTLSAEPFGRVIIEAFMAKVPVISTALGGASELVRHEESGLVYKAYSADELFMCIRKLVLDPKLRSRVLEVAYQNYLQIKASNNATYGKLFT